MALWWNWQTQGTLAILFSNFDDIEFGQIIKANLIGEQEQIDRNIYAEWVLNGETFPNGNTVPITFVSA